MCRSKPRKIQILIDSKTRVRALFESLPYIQKFRGAVIVVKYGGNAMEDAVLRQSFARDVALIKHVGMQPVVVHGGGPMISKVFADNGIESRFVNGLRVTDSEGMPYVEQALAEVNTEIKDMISAQGVLAVGLCGKRGKVLLARRVSLESGDGSSKDVRNGEALGISPSFPQLISQEEVVPVVCPIGVAEDGVSLNINADHAALTIAVSLRAEKLVIMTNVPGIVAKDGSLLATVGYEQAAALIRDGEVYGGMLPKLQCALDAVAAGVKAAHITDGRVEHVLLLELLTDDGMGTLIAKS